MLETGAIFELVCTMDLNVCDYHVTYPFQFLDIKVTIECRFTLKGVGDMIFILQSNAQYRKVLTTQLNHLASLATWLSVHLPTNWLYIQILLLSLKLQILCLF